MWMKAQRILVPIYALEYKNQFLIHKDGWKLDNTEVIITFSSVTIIESYTNLSIVGGTIITKSSC